MQKKLTILQINDTHSYLELHNELFYERDKLAFRKAGGYARLQSLIKDFRSKNPTLVFDNGDTIHGTYEAIATKGWHMLPVLNEVGFDAMTFHWDTGFGPDNLKQIGKQLDYPILAINAYEKESGKLAFEPYKILSVGELSIGVIGIACNIIDKTMPPHFSEGLSFTLGREELPRYVAELKEKEVNLIIVLSHLGFPQDLKLMSEVEGVAICLSGHTHNRQEHIVTVGETAVIQSGSHGSFLGALELTVEDGAIQSIEHQLIPVTEDIPEDAEMKVLVEDALSPYREKLELKVGETKKVLHRGWSVETTMDNFLSDAILYHTKTDLAFSNGWRYGVPILKGPVTLRELYQIIPMDPPISTAILTGSEIVTLLEENLESTYAADPFNQMGGYLKRAMGLHAYLKLENPKGTRVQKLFIAGEEVIPDKEYNVSYVTNQGVPKKFGKEHKNLEKHAVEAMMDYLAEMGPYEKELRGTYQIV